MPTLAFIDGVRATAVTSGTAGVTTQDFTVGSTSLTPKAALIHVVRATADDTLQDDFMDSLGVTDGTFQGGIANSYINHNGAVILTVAKRVGFDDAVIRLPLSDASGFAAVGSFDSFISGGIRIRWDTIPIDTYYITVTLFFGDVLQAKAGSAIPPSAGSGTSQIATGFQPSHIVTLCNQGSSLSESFNANTDLQIAHTVKTTGTSVSTRCACWNYIDNVATTSGTVFLSSSGVGHVFTGGSTPVTPSVSTEIASLHASDGFNIQSSGSGTGPLIVYLAIRYGESSVSLTSFQSPTSTGNVTYSAGFKVGGCMSLQTIFNNASWPGDAVNANSGSSAIGLLTPSGEFTSGHRAIDNQISADIDSYTDPRLLSTWQSVASVARTYRGSGSFHSSDGVTINYSDVVATGRQVALLMIQIDVFSAIGNALLPTISGSGTGVQEFQGSETGSIPGLQGSATAQQIFSSTCAASTPGSQGTATAEIQHSGSCDGATPSLQSSGLSVVQHTGSSDSLLGAVQAAGLSVIEHVASGNALLGAVQGSGTGIVVGGTSLECVHQLAGSYSSIAPLIGSYDLVAELDGSYDGRADLRGSIC